MNGWAFMMERLIQGAAQDWRIDENPDLDKEMTIFNTFLLIDAGYDLDRVKDQVRIWRVSNLS